MKLDTLCGTCGVRIDEHDYEHEARVCMPRTIALLAKRVDDLRAENARLREALEAIRHLHACGFPHKYPATCAACIARAALVGATTNSDQGKP